ncbi:hypothetical protein TREMEDRAFT_73304 [Tremella mesenterica DSM 1558]|uniref:uncharacterized protein n=1 Tax=Tremella mesenterica (strain ATCC 24925 / CBS 8224 / DSM 1558 / NBRC 9311 / NRRL Y-6157 / RJB 2259-6 / UBC 559-6) TaxID=578456 RepID=UPI0003F48FA3|nr:uncharacterized protein TREMEDRAFT_73304 [Tremella mesenterica DSM 1558]EIW71441.1 hypothetical protein TREMEDRAFT_73304 [Tremella mesenterica DSM 1558]
MTRHLATLALILLHTLSIPTHASPLSIFPTPIDGLPVRHPFIDTHRPVSLYQWVSLRLLRKLEQRQESNGGWMTRWLSIGGEGAISIYMDHENLTLPHRPSAFPSHLVPPTTLPLSGILEAFDSFPDPRPGPPEIDTSSHTFKSQDPGLACVSPIWPPIRFEKPKKPFKVAFVERGGCDFATKVRAAQERGAAGVVVGDSVARLGETDEEGRMRENLITMFSPEDTMGIYIPSVFVSRASFLLFRDLLSNGTNSGRSEGKGLWIEISEGSDEGSALSSLLSFALLLPSTFLLITIAIHRVRVARQREADRAPPLLVLSLPERIWSPDIVWEKDSSSSSSPSSPLSPIQHPLIPSSSPSSTNPDLSPPVRILSADESPLQNHNIEMEDQVGPLDMQPSTSKPGRKHRHKSHAKKYFSKDECAICMDQFEKGDVVRILPCGHVFHKNECDEWLLKWRKLCPTCRADVTIPPGSEMQGSRLTPVSTDPNFDPILERPTLLSRLTSLRTQAWRSISRLRRGNGTDETTPLFRDSDGEERRSRRSDVTDSTIRPSRRQEATV